jgi:hypothetical protein
MADKRQQSIGDYLAEIVVVRPYYRSVNRLPYMERIELGQLKDLLQLERKCRQLGREPVKLTLRRDDEVISVGLDRLVELAEQDLLCVHNGSAYFIVDGVCWKLGPPLRHPQKDASP